MSNGSPPDVKKLEGRFRSGFFHGPIGVRKVGREAEYPVVDADGNAFDIAELWGDLAGPGLEAKFAPDGMQVALDGMRYSYASEVGTGTIEVITGPRHDLVQLCRDHELAMQRLVKVAAAHGARVLAMGTQPKTVASTALMTPKPRYGLLHEVIGDPWLTFTLTASDQTHVDVASQEIIPVANLCNMLAPFIIALCGNSGLVSDGDAGVCSWRESAMGTIQPDVGRHGMPIEPAKSLEHHIQMLCELPHLMDRQGPESVAGNGAPFADFANGMDDERAWEAFLVHEHYVWHSARPRSRQGTVELRCAGQQPWKSHMAASALSLGVVAGAAEISQYVMTTLGTDAWSIMREWHKQAIVHGLASVEPASDFVLGILDRAKGALRGRGRSEVQYIEPLYWRLDRRENPAQRLRSILEAEGMDAAIAYASIPSLIE